MGREKAEFRDILERLDTAFPGKEMLSKAEIAGWLGVSRNTVTRRFSWPRGKVPKTLVARSVAGI